MIRFGWQQGATLLAMGVAATLAGCGEKAPPPRPLPPPPPVVVVIPPKPTPPDGASPYLIIPPADAAGLRASVNRNISNAQTVWNLRAAYNVAALNCPAIKFAQIVPSYRAFLKTNKKALTFYNSKVDAEFRSKYGTKFIAPREKYMTEVYNHFALPPTMDDFCTAVLAVSRDAVVMPANDLEGFAVRSLPSIEVVFDNFYRRYEAYSTRLAAWNALYLPSATALQSIPASSTAPASPTLYGPQSSQKR